MTGKYKRNILVLSAWPGSLLHSFVRWHEPPAIYHYKELPYFNTGASPFAHYPAAKPPAKRKITVYLI
jgi:hypothetical protein